MDLQELLRDGLRHFERDELDEASACCRRVLNIQQSNAAAVQLMARIDYRQGRVEEAISGVRELVQRYPDQGSLWNDLGLILAGSQRPEEAAEAFQRAVELNPADMRATVNGIHALLEMGRIDEALDWISKFRQHSGDHSLLRRESIGCLRAAKRWEEAAAVAEELLKERPDDEALYQTLVGIRREEGNPRLLLEALDRWQARFPDNPVAEHLRKSLVPATVGTEPERASDAYIRHVFDRFAENFDASLAELEYQTPAQVGEIVHELWCSLGDPNLTWRILDAGCGTGLCGPYLHPHASYLCGVDLSSGMLAVARSRGLYHMLVEAELTQFFRQSAADTKGEWDIVVASDVFNYFGDLREVLSLMYETLSPNGAAIFTLETLATPEGSSFSLSTTGRYLHWPPTVLELLREIGFSTADSQPAVMRKQAGKDVHGAIFVARR